ncbi:hypothetical protein [Clostridium tagluense]|uniref:Uncharacterized protein n=1 Tax=Clostridium tagluense TaxID=360422 RepID=A0A401UT06_9CLOT|nr:hypothetical protein [Clostridium tagluense]GCD12588.1 hypothetical protein Ctaglu_42110 [Clostridium tagluense]
MSKQLGTYDIETEAKVGFVTVYDIDDKLRGKKFLEKKKQNIEFQEMQDTICGNFVFFIFKNINHLQEILNDSELAKFVFIGTYIKKNGALMEDNNKVYITKEVLKQKLKLGSTNFPLFYNKILHNKLIEQRGDKIYINIAYFYRGNEVEYKKISSNKLEDFTRLYTKTTRELFIQTPVRGQGKLVIVYKLLPYVNWKYNVLCKNSDEINKDKIELLTVGDVIDLLGYNRSNTSRFKKDFYGLKYCNYNIFKTIQGDMDYSKSTVAVNPLLYYKGSDSNEFKMLMLHFGIKI